MPAIVLPFWVNSCLRAWLTHWWLVQSYHKTTNLSRGPIQSSMPSGVASKTHKGLVSPSKAMHVSHAVVLPLPPKDGTVSHPVSAVTSRANAICTCLVCSWCRMSVFFLFSLDASHSPTTRAISGPDTSVAGLLGSQSGTQHHRHLSQRH
jgi:hypothetical protein